MKCVPAGRSRKSTGMEMKLTSSSLCEKSSAPSKSTPALTKLNPLRIVNGPKSSPIARPVWNPILASAVGLEPSLSLTFSFVISGPKVNPKWSRFGFFACAISPSCCARTVCGAIETDKTAIATIRKRRFMCRVGHLMRPRSAISPVSALECNSRARRHV